MINNENAFAIAKSKLEQRYPGHRFRSVQEIPGGWYVSHYPAYSDFSSLRPFIMNRWDGSLTEVCGEMHNRYTQALHYVDHLPEEQQRLARAEWDKLPYHPVRFFPYRIELGLIRDGAVLDNVTFAMEIDMPALMEAGFAQIPAVAPHFRSVGEPRLLRESKQGDTIRREYRIVFDHAILQRERTRYIEDGIHLERPKESTITGAMDRLLRTTTFFVDGELAPALTATGS